MRRLAVISLLGSWLTLSAAAARACPFCGPPPDSPGLAMAAADATVVAEVVGRKLAFSGDGAAKVVVQFKVTQIIRGSGPAAGETVAVAFPDASLAPQMIRTVVALRKSAVGWESAGAYGDADARLSRYLTGLAALPVDRPAERIAYLLESLEDGNADIAADAHGQFASIPFAEIAKVRERLPHERLREWIRSDKVPVERKGLYALMLFAIDDSRDTPRLIGVLPDVAGNAAATGGVLAALCRTSATPERFLPAHVREGDWRFAQREGAVRAAGFLLEHGSDSEKAAAMNGIRTALSDRRTFPYAVEELIRIGEWSLTDSVVGAWSDPARTGEAVRLFVRKYVRALPEERRRALTGPAAEASR